MCKQYWSLRAFWISREHDFILSELIEKTYQSRAHNESLKYSITCYIHKNEIIFIQTIKSNFNNIFSIVCGYVIVFGVK